MARLTRWVGIGLAISLGFWGTTSSAGAASNLITESVCFVVHVPGDPTARNVFGTRYHTGPVTPNREAILLVHGGSTRGIWDFREDFSVARNLARAGYVVIAYDQLGFPGDSHYERPQGERTLTLQGFRAMLHEVVGSLKGGDYGIDGYCSRDDGGTAEAGSQNVVLAGHSGGGAIVSGYPGQYHDVAAVVQAAWSNQGFDPSGIAPGGWLWNMARQYATGSERLYLFLDDHGRFNRSQCETFAFHPPGIDPDIRTAFCAEPNIKTIAAPAGAFPTLPPFVIENQINIRQVGPDIPVLIVWPEFDSGFRQQDRDAEDRHWREHCGCDVTSWTASDAGHAFQVHRSMPTFTDKVVTWLHSKGLDA